MKKNIGVFTVGPEANSINKGHLEMRRDKEKC